MQHEPLHVGLRRRVPIGAARRLLQAVQRGSRSPDLPVQPLREHDAVHAQNAAAPLSQRGLCPEVGDDLHQVVPEPRDGHPARDLLQQAQRVAVGPDLLEQRGGELRRVGGVRYQHVPQLVVALVVDELHGLRDVLQLVNDEAQRPGSVAHAPQDEDHLAYQAALLANVERFFQCVLLAVREEVHHRLGVVLRVQLHLQAVVLRARVRLLQEQRVEVRVQLLPPVLRRLRQVRLGLGGLDGADDVVDGHRIRVLHQQRQGALLVDGHERLELGAQAFQQLVLQRKVEDVQASQRQQDVQHGVHVALNLEQLRHHLTQHGRAAVLCQARLRLLADVLRAVEAGCRPNLY
mmetsp:Transcript_16464/g.42204  ORF Transcript_16464/g.42204 Transcript_16464/m.42204 type:complete len:348 (+) Transcript_16464:575-1618(+)